MRKVNEEKRLEKAIIQYLELQGWYAVKVQSGILPQFYKGQKRFIHLAPTGTPDVHCCINGKAVYIEVKKDDDTARKWEKVVDKFESKRIYAKSNEKIIKQHQAHVRIVNAGGTVIICGSLEELQRDLFELGFIPSPSFYVRPKTEAEKIGIKKQKGKSKEGTSNTHSRQRHRR